MEKALVATRTTPSTQVQKSRPGATKSKGKCFNCGIKGHWAKDCEKPKKERRSEQAANVVTADSHSLFWTAPNSSKVESLTWYIDSGASKHMSCKREWMQNYTEFPIAEIVRLGDNRAVEVLGKGTVWLKVKSGGVYQARIQKKI
eukprot:gene9617-10600_t